MTGIELIAAERQRQIDVEGFTLEYDDTNDQGELAAAASCYGFIASYQSFAPDPSIDGGVRPLGWPWEMGYYKPSDDPIRNLVKAAALLAAEIDRLQRAKGE